MNKFLYYNSIILYTSQYPLWKLASYVAPIQSKKLFTWLTHESYKEDVKATNYWKKKIWSKNDSR